MQRNGELKINSFQDLFELTPLVDQPESQPNFILMVTDEERSLRGYEAECVKKFHEKIQGQKALKENGITFAEHRTSAAACVPARATLYTGQHQSLHGLSQTNGGAKNEADSNMHWLDPAVPTLGTYFEKAGYETVYIGKWHLSVEDILNENRYAKLSKPIAGERDKKICEEYLRKDPLAKYGFHGWIGPEPHGSAVENAGFNCDPEYVRQACEWLLERQKSKNKKPFILVLNLVNPHDIVFIPILWLYYSTLYNLPQADESLKNVTLPPSIGDTLADKPAVQKAYRERYSKMFCLSFVNGSDQYLKKNNWFNYFYQKMYWTFVGLADQHIKTVYDVLKHTDFFHNTYVVKTSDHGDLTGAHGLVQKWYNAYEETLRVPFIISHPLFKNKGKTYSGLTSHVDLFPTLLKLAGLDQHKLTTALSKSYCQAKPLVGKVIGQPENFSAINTEKYQILESSYFITTDNIMNGDQNYSVLGQLYPVLQYLSSVSKVEPIGGNTYIEMVVAKIQIRNKLHYFKYACYQMPPDSKEHIQVEEELYDLLEDNNEMHNLAKNPKPGLAQEALSAMKTLLEFERVRKLQKPNDQKNLETPAKTLPNKHHGPGNGFLLTMSTPALLLGLTAGFTLFKCASAIRHHPEILDKVKHFVLKK